MTDLLTRHFEEIDAHLREGKMDGLDHLRNYVQTLERALKPGITVEQYRYAISAARRRLAHADEFDPGFADGS